SFEKALALKPNYAEALNNLGIVYMELGQLDESVKCYEKSIAIRPNYAEALNNLGLTLKELGQLDEAIKYYEKSIAIKPDYAEALNNLGSVFMELGQLDDAIKNYKKALVLKPDYANAHNNLGNALKELGQLNAAAKCYEKAIAIKPDYAGAHNNLGVVFMELDQLDEAVKCFEKSLTIKPDYANAHNNLGSVLIGLDQQDEAVKCFEKALAIKPDFAEAHNNFGIIFKEMGQTDEAVKCFEKALFVNPDYAQAYRHLVTIKKYIASDPQISQMQSILSNGDLSKSDRIHLCFALAKVYENLGKQDELFKFLHEGNRLRKQELNYSLDMDQITHSVVKKLFNPSPSDVEKSLSYEASTIRPIFILGMPRSGTSLVEQIIASHHAVHGAGELHTLNNLINPIVKDHSTNDKNSLSEKTFLSIRQQYLDSLYSFNVPENVITDKMPINFRWIGFILLAFPEAKIVHLKRDAMAICWSNYKHYFSAKGLGFSYSMDDLAGYYGLYTDFMAFWHQLYSDKIYDICYEDLTTNQEKETRKLLEYCELDWDENCLEFHTNKRVVKTASKFQVREKMYQGSSEAWKKHKEYLRPLIKALSS
ncbi:tetratricopeptide repeat protein, partial [Candidatus Thioglobus sp.]|nr:tetratricopeptide repeat protein [Candidatus Thioglobus sp.]